MRLDVQMRNNAITIQELRVYLAERYGIRKGNRIKYTERGEKKKWNTFMRSMRFIRIVCYCEIFSITQGFARVTEN